MRGQSFRMPSFLRRKKRAKRRENAQNAQSAHSFWCIQELFGRELRAPSAMRIFRRRMLWSPAGPERGRGAADCRPLLLPLPVPACPDRSRGAPRARSFHVRALPSGGELGAQLRKSLAMGMCEYQECPQSLISPLESADPKNSLRKSFAICSYTKTQGYPPLAYALQREPLP